ncbi:MAG TPA: transglycosylase SLT domain-containing protein [Saprospiraceae bacterium]|nr:transglycosylase SLT domain-containing protein [Saprospiraceae bacterium]
MNIKFVCRLFVSTLGLLSVLAWTNPFELDAIFENHLDEQEEVIRERIPTVVTIVNPTYNTVVRSYLNTYIYRRPAQTTDMLGWAAYYFPKFEKALTAEGLPTDLKYLAIVESALNPNAISRSGAGGLWQFMKPTARECGLKCGTYIDERMDPEKSSKAAASYLKQLYTMFGNWELVMAAYNAGPGRIRSAIKRSGTSDYWKLQKYLPAETQNYVPAFIAASYIMNYHYEHNICPQVPEHAMGELTSVMIYDGTYISDIAARSGMSEIMVKGLNPSFVRNFIPASETGNMIWLPATAAELFNAGRNMEPPLVHMEADANAEIRTVTINGTLFNIITTRKEYRVRSGDNLYTIAQRNDCSVTDLMSWNKLRNNHLSIGQRLEIRNVTREIAPIAIEPPPPPVAVRNDLPASAVPSLSLENLSITQSPLSVSFSIAPRIAEQTSERVVLKRRQSVRQALDAYQLTSVIHTSQIIIPGNAVAGDVIRVKSKA